jgi:tetratricopeptide (TPR) repeat protein
MESLANEQPGDVRLQIGLAESLQRGGGPGLLAPGAPSVIKERLEKALALLQKLEGEGQAHPELMPQLAFCLEHLGDLELILGAPDVAERHLQDALRSLEALPEHRAKEPRIRQHAAGLIRKLGQLAQVRGDVSAALGRYANALHLFEALARQNPRNVSVQGGRAGCLLAMGELKAARDGGLEEAKSDLSEARALLEDLQRRVPTSPSFGVSLFYALIGLGQLAEAEKLLISIEQSPVPADLVAALRQKLKHLQGS